jgi:hypothetical protein
MCPDIWFEARVASGSSAVTGRIVVENKLLDAI